MYTFLVFCTQMNPERPRMYYCSLTEFFNTINILRHLPELWYIVLYLV